MRQLAHKDGVNVCPNPMPIGNLLTRAPRTGPGIKSDGTLFVVVDGRNKDISVGNDRVC